MGISRRQLLLGGSAAALVTATGLAGLAWPPAPAAPSADLLDQSGFHVRPEEVPALVARLESRTGAPVHARGDRLLLATPGGGTRAVRLGLIL